MTLDNLLGNCFSNSQNRAWACRNPSRAAPRRPLLGPPGLPPSPECTELSRKARPISQTPPTSRVQNKSLEGRTWGHTIWLSHGHAGPTPSDTLSIHHAGQGLQVGFRGWVPPSCGEGGWEGGGVPPVTEQAQSPPYSACLPGPV